MRVIRTSGSEGGAAQTVPTPIAARRLASEGALSATTGSCLLYTSDAADE